jgi:hypothetical protein
MSYPESYPERYCQAPGCGKLLVPKTFSNGSMTGLCEIEGCGRPHHSHGICNVHRALKDRQTKLKAKIHDELREKVIDPWLRQMLGGN